MATIVATPISANAVSTLATETILEGTDVLLYTGKTKCQILEITNDTGDALTLNLVGDASASFSVQGYGEVDPTSGYDMAVADGEVRSVILSGLDKFLTDADGSIAITGGTGAVAKLYEIA